MGGKKIIIYNLIYELAALHFSVNYINLRVIPSRIHAFKMITIDSSL